MSDSGEITGPAAAAAAGIPVPDPPGVAWSEQEEYLLSLWADRALCYKLMHESAQQIYKRHHMWFSIPVIILSTITGTANVAISAYVPTAYQGIAQLIIGAINLFGGALSTLQNYFRSSEKCEAHRHASVSWGKLYRSIFVELSVARAKRRPVVDFVRVCRTDYDRLTEGSPPLRHDVRAAFALAAAAAAAAGARGANKHLILPEECGTLLHTSSWEHAGDDRTRALAARGAADFLEDAATATAIANGAIANGAIANGAIANGAIANGAIANGAIANKAVDTASALFANKASAMSTNVVGALAASLPVNSAASSDDFILALSKSPSSVLACADNYFPKKLPVAAALTAVNAAVEAAVPLPEIQAVEPAATAFAALAAAPAVAALTDAAALPQAAFEAATMTSLTAEAASLAPFEAASLAPFVEAANQNES
jgi:hypothetical protein